MMQVKILMACKLLQLNFQVQIILCFNTGCISKLRLLELNQGMCARIFLGVQIAEILMISIRITLESRKFQDFQGGEAPRTSSCVWPGLNCKVLMQRGVIISLLVTNQCKFYSQSINTKKKIFHVGIFSSIQGKIFNCFN